MMKYRKLKNRLLFLLTEKERKEGRRITQIEVARAIGISSNTMSSWVHNDITKFEAPIVERICDYFQCDVSDLLYFEVIEPDESET